LESIVEKKDVLEVLIEMRARKRPCAIATVIETTGSSSAKPSSKAIIDATGRVVAGWVGGGCAESMTCSQALECIKTGATAILDLDLDSEVLGAGMPCGGSMRVYIEPVLPRPALWLMGHGRIAESLCQMADLQGFEIVVIDPLADAPRYPAAARLVRDDPMYEQLQPQQDDFVVVATQHKGDHRSLLRALRSEARYLALIASAKRSRLVLDYLRQEGVSEQDLLRLRAPAGLDLGARTPEEIALCVVAEMVLVRRGGRGGLMRERLAQEPAERPRPMAAGAIGASCGG
jgi:xanthine dehydrogenase accessory factor